MVELSLPREKREAHIERNPAKANIAEVESAEMAPLLRVAIASDLHCHSSNELQESFLIASAVRDPAGCHPVQALIDLIREETLRADVLVSPGDLAHQASTPGLVQCWDHLRELGGELGASSVYCTIGNHDVASREAGGDPYRTLKQFHPDFPFKDPPAKAQFWANGFVAQPIGKTAELVILNTSYHHYSEASARAGTFPNARVHELNSYLKSRPFPGVRIALLHHHPVLHSSAGFDSSDVLPNGDEILDVLASNGCSLVIHGHRHQPRLRRHPAAGKQLLVFAAGSFSKFLKSLGTQTRNLFHYLELDGFEGPEPCGTIRTWEFNYSDGWRPTGPKSSRFPHLLSFGPKPAGDIPEKLAELLETPDVMFAGADAIEKHVPNLDRLLPEEFESLQNQLLKRSIKLIRDETGQLEGVGRTKAGKSSAGVVP